jgi:hypothetical protein
VLTFGRNFIRVALGAGPNVHRNSLVLEQATIVHDKSVRQIQTALDLTDRISRTCARTKS